jgi:hypothetical protein
VTGRLEEIDLVDIVSERVDRDVEMVTESVDAFLDEIYEAFKPPVAAFTQDARLVIEATVDSHEAMNSSIQSGSRRDRRRFSRRRFEDGAHNVTGSTPPVASTGSSETPTGIDSSTPVDVTGDSAAAGAQRCTR